MRSNLIADPLKGHLYNLRSRHKIRKNREVEQVLQSGLRVNDGFMSLTSRAIPVSAKKLVSESRIAIRVPRAFGNAVQRNRAKRLVRETFRLERDKLKYPVDLIVHLKPPRSVQHLNLASIRNHWLFLCNKAGLLSSSAPPQQ